MTARVLSVAALAILAAWLGGFLWFVHVSAMPGPAVPAADGIVVLTGGSNRVAQGLALLRQGKAPRLLVSGVSPGTSVAMLAGPDAATLANRVTLGDSAISTHGNAEETAAWVARYRLQSLIVVTAFYHMPRALAELHRALPRTVLYARPVLPDALATGDATTPFALLFKEYAKWLAVRLGVPRIGQDRRPETASP